MQNAPLLAFCNTFDLLVLKTIFGLFESYHFTQVLLYVLNYTDVIILYSTCVVSCTFHVVIDLKDEPNCYELDQIISQLQVSYRSVEEPLDV